MPPINSPQQEGLMSLDSNKMEEKVVPVSVSKRSVLRPKNNVQDRGKDGEIVTFPLTETFVKRINSDEGFNHDYYNGLSDEHKMIVDQSLGKDIQPAFVGEQIDKLKRQMDEVKKLMDKKKVEEAASILENRTLKREIEELHKRMDALEPALHAALDKLRQIDEPKVIAKVSDGIRVPLQNVIPKQVSPQIVSQVQMSQDMSSTYGNVSANDSSAVVSPAETSPNNNQSSVDTSVSPVSPSVSVSQKQEEIKSVHPIDGLFAKIGL